MTQVEFLTIAARMATIQSAAWARVASDGAVSHEHRQFAKSISIAFAAEANEMLELAESCRNA